MKWSLSPCPLFKRAYFCLINKKYSFNLFILLTSSFFSARLTHSFFIYSCAGEYQSNLFWFNIPLRNINSDEQHRWRAHYCGVGVGLEAAMFLVGKKNSLLNALGVNYGTINLEGCDPFSIIDAESAEADLNRAVAKNLVEPEQVPVIMDQIRAAGVAPTLKAVFELAAKTEVPEGFEPSFLFVLHKDCGVPLPHGIIVEPDEGQTLPLMTLVEGLEFLVKWVEDRDIPLHVLDGVYLMKKMIAANLPVNEADSKAQYEALPQEVRDQLKAQSPLHGVGVFSIPGLGDVVVMEIRLPVRGQQASAK